MLYGLCALLLSQLVGESIVYVLGLPFPGPVLGFLLLFIAMKLGSRWASFPQAGVESAASGLLANLGLFFVPAGVGIVALTNTLGGNITSVAMVLVLSAVVTLIVTVWAFIVLDRLVRGKSE